MSHWSSIHPLTTVAQKTYEMEQTAAKRLLERLMNPPEDVWWEAEQRYPKADLVRLRNGSLGSDAYDRYARLEGSVSPALRGCHDDTLEALRLLRNKLKQKALDRLGETTADQISQSVAKQFSGAKTTISSSDFSSHWLKDA